VRATALVAALALAAAPAVAQHAHEGARHGNPADLDRYIAGLADPARDAWQQPDRVVAALGLAPGDTACDVGAGPGYFSLRLARAVGETGRVFAVDVEPRILDALRERLGAAGIRNVTPVLALADDPLLPAQACDVVLVVDTYHHFPERVAYLERLRGALAPGGRLVNIDFRLDAPFGPRREERVSRERFLAEAERAGLATAGEETFLAHQYFVTLKPH